jgi:DNA-binding XRE family transcriptional regulator
MVPFSQFQHAPSQPLDRTLNGWYDADNAPAGRNRHATPNGWKQRRLVSGRYRPQRYDGTNTISERGRAGVLGGNAWLPREKRVAWDEASQLIDPEHKLFRLRHGSLSQALSIYARLTTDWYTRSRHERRNRAGVRLLCFSGHFSNRIALGSRRAMGACCIIQPLPKPVGQRSMHHPQMGHAPSKHTGIIQPRRESAMSEATMTLRQARDYRALSQEDLGTAAQIAVWTIRQIERQRTYPRPSTRRKIAQALGLQPWEIAWRGSEP